jgi:membrane dipeptidase
MRIFDLHADLGWDIRRLHHEGETEVLKNHHLENLKAGDVLDVAAACFFEGTESWADMQEMITLTRQEIEQGDIRWIRSRKDLDSRTTKVSAMITIEGMCGIHAQPEEKIRWMYEQGARVGTLTWNDSNDLATGKDGSPVRGVTAAGMKAIRQMNRLHMIVDVSHANEKTFWDEITLSSLPVIATHSNARSLCDVERNLTNQQIRAIAARDGLIGMNSAKSFIAPKKKDQDARHLAMHARYIADLVGHEHVACGFDFMDFFDGYRRSNDLGEAVQAQNFLEALKGQGFSADEVSDIAWRNAFRFFRKYLSD